MEQPTLPPPTEDDLFAAANKLSVPEDASEGDLRVAQFLRLLAPQMAMFASMLPPQG